MTSIATIRIAPLPGEARIDQRIYGHFLESAFFGNIEGGVFDEGSPLAVNGPGPLAGCRRDVIEAFRELGLPVVRWPGGNFTSPYWWQDGIGPRDERPRRLELAWGSEESNRFGTPEFLAWCEAVGTTPYLAHHARQVDDGVRWVEYTNYAGDTTLTRQRAADGHPDPHDVPIWGLGNEVYGPWQMGHRRVGDYVDAAREHARFMRAVDPSIAFVAVGDTHEDWNQAVVAGLGELVDWVSLHLYGASRHLVDPSAEEFDAVVAQAVFFEQEIAAQAQTIGDTQVEHGLTRPLAIAMDEWNIRHLEPRAWPEPQAGDDGGVAAREEAASAPDGFDVEGFPGGHVRVNRYSPRTLADALFYAGVFHAMHRTAHQSVPVTMANTVNLVNANGLLAVRPGGVVRQSTFHVWDLYQNHTGPVPLAADVSGPSRTARVRHGDHRRSDGEFRTSPAVVGQLDVSASTSEDGRTLYVTGINRSATDDVNAQIVLDGVTLPETATVRRIGAGVDDLFAVNTMAAPDVVALSAPASVSLAGGVHTFPAHSISVLEIALEG
ncbi:Alpha-N-arabinofuranosidase [Beutenbergia cavernae DSM 12333]|uniref:non-reducing end alpha-L-arabinofuranosidase n=1 Tax=Beutenbergia cavernae (strain ATCC BAA-8 / DSM 12333 / CCUG 43141 / JCM 11478 / NBRC 16432 / NCIMB 13614 / HKI 0122) TaxID=471853 RepID=C5BVK6_BEUC1|nr:alpha-L-arabinofuranosidase C-terminal domain-containing protein [Beutenbergia cavernae]ACQ78446.1 Alpha-N-arabinofuranosidase [Beutenbergia cavernae DSM 12333]